MLRLGACQCRASDLQEMNDRQIGMHTGCLKLLLYQAQVELCLLAVLILLEGAKQSRQAWMASEFDKEAWPARTGFWSDYIAVPALE